MPYPVKNFLVFPNPALYFSQIPDPEDTLQGTVSDSLLALVVAGCQNTIQLSVINQRFLSFSYFTHEPL